jgi:hypothetical protein
LTNINNHVNDTAVQSETIGYFMPLQYLMAIVGKDGIGLALVMAERQQNGRRPMQRRPNLLSEKRGMQ